LPKGTITRSPGSNVSKKSDSYVKGKLNILGIKTGTFILKI